MLIDPDKLQALIDERGWNYADVARQVVRTRQHIRNLATGQRRQVSKDLADRLIWLFDVKPSDLFVMPKLTEQSDRKGSPDESSAGADPDTTTIEKDPQK